MDSKKLKISLELDDKAFSNAVKRMQGELAKIQTSPQVLQQQKIISQKMQQLGLGPLPGAPDQRQIEQANQKAKQQSEKLFQDTIKNFAAIKREQKELNEEQTKGLASEERKLKIRERLRELQGEELRTTGELRAQTETRSAQQQFNRQQMLGGAIKGVTALAEAIDIASNIYGNLKRRPIETQSMAGSAMQGTLGRELESVYSGRQGIEMAFLPEKAKAAQMAMESMKGVAFRDWGKALSSIALQAIAGSAAGAIGGGALGSIIPGIGNIIGAGAGAVLGGIGGAGRAISDKDTYNTLSFSQGATQAVSARRALEFASNFNEAYEGLKNQNPLKRMAAEEYNQNAMKNLEFQRTLGLDFSTFHGPGGFRERAINQGFTPEASMDMASQIMAAGGSTQMGRESIFGNQVARGFNVTNAGSVLGKLSQTLSSPQSTEQAFIKMLAKGTQLGLDTSETRKFLEETTDVISRSETGSQTDIGDIVKRFGGFVSEGTPRGLEAAKSAFSSFNQITSSNTGPQGVMRAAGFLQDDVIGKMSPMDRASLSTIPTDQLTSDHPVIQSLARQYKVSPEDLKNRVLKAGIGAIHRLPQGDIQAKNLANKRNAMKGPMSPQILDRMNAEIMRQEQDYEKTIAVEYPELAKNRKQLEAFAKGTSQGTPEDIANFMDKFQAGMKKETPTGKAEDETMKGMAESSRLMLTTFQQLKDEIVPTAEAVGKFNNRLKETVDIIMKMPEAERSGLLQRLYTNLTGGDKSQTQPQSGK